MEVCIVSKGDIKIIRPKRIRLHDSLLMGKNILTIEGDDYTFTIKDGKVFGGSDLTTRRSGLDYITRIDFFVFGRRYSLYDFTVEEIINTLDFLK